MSERINRVTWETDDADNLTHVIGPSGRPVRVAPSSRRYLSETMAQALADAVGMTIYDTYGQSAPEVSAVTLGATALPGGQVIDIESDALRLFGAPYRAGRAGQPKYNVDATSGAIQWRLRNAPGATNEAMRGQHARARFYGKTVQLIAEGYGLSSNYLPMWVRNVARGGPWRRVSFVAGAVASNSRVQLDMAEFGLYEIAVGMQESITIRGMALEADGVWVAVPAAEPVPLVGDSYVAGRVSPDVTGDPCLIGAMTHLTGGDFNFINMGVSDTGWATPAGVNYGFTHAERLQYLADVTNYSGARVAVYLGGLNDADTGKTAGQVQTEAANAIAHFKAATSARLVILSCQPATRNNSAAVQAVNQGLEAAVNLDGSDRVAFENWTGSVTGTKDLDTASGVAGLSRYVTGNDGIHLGPSFTSGGNEYVGRRLLAGIASAAGRKGW